MRQPATSILPWKNLALVECCVHSCVMLSLTATISCGVTWFRIKHVLETPWLPHLAHLKLQDNLITHMGPLPSLPFLQTLDLSFNVITDFSMVQTLASFKQLCALRVNDNPVQHTPHFHFSLQRLMPFVQHEFGNASEFPDERQIRVIQQAAVLNSPEVFQACMQSGHWGGGGVKHGDPFGLVSVPGLELLAHGDVGEPRGAQLVVEIQDADVANVNGVQARVGDADRHSRAAPNSTATVTGLGQHELAMLEGGARRLLRSQVRLT